MTTNKTPPFVLAAIALTPFAAAADLPEMPGHTVVAYEVDTGPVAAARRAESKPEFEVAVPGASWLRLAFEEAALAPGATIRITSFADGAQQVLDAAALRAWNNSSAYFNGEAVLVEVLPGSTAEPSRVRISEIWTGSPMPRSICGSTDDRALSSDPRSGRFMPVGCTAWMFDGRSNDFITAGHCDMFTYSVMEFNVPLSNEEGSPEHPGPEDQYPIDWNSKQIVGSVTLGNDWAYFGVGDNTDTGLTPLGAMGDSYTLVDSPPPLDGRTTRITGYGATNNPEWNLVQKTHTGPFVGHSGTVLQYAVDTTGGNSGSAVIDETTNTVFGIHTNAGCSLSGGANHGTAIDNTGLQAALASPQGICARTLGYSVAGGAPTTIGACGDTTMSIQIGPAGGLAPAGDVQGKLHVFASGVWDDTDIVHVSGTTYEATFPAAAPGTTISYYLSALASNGQRYTWPAAGRRAALTATVDASTCCPADLNGDGVLDFFDVSIYLGWFNTSDPQADLNFDGTLNFFDVSIFLADFSAGCP